MPNKDDGIPENGGGLDSLEQSISPFPTRKSIVSEAKANMLNAAADGMRADSGLRLEITKEVKLTFSRLNLWVIFLITLLSLFDVILIFKEYESAEATVITEKVIIALIAGTVAQAGVAIIAIVRYLFPQTNGQRLLRENSGSDNRDGTYGSLNNYGAIMFVGVLIIGILIGAILIKDRDFYSMIKPTETGLKHGSGTADSRPQKIGECEINVSQNTIVDYEQKPSSGLASKKPPQKTNKSACLKTDKNDDIRLNVDSR